MSHYPYELEVSKLSFTSKADYPKITTPAFDHAFQPSPISQATPSMGKIKLSIRGKPMQSPIKLLPSKSEKALPGIEFYRNISEELVKNASESRRNMINRQISKANSNPLPKLTLKTPKQSISHMSQSQQPDEISKYSTPKLNKEFNIPKSSIISKASKEVEKEGLREILKMQINLNKAMNMSKEKQRMEEIKSLDSKNQELYRAFDEIEGLRKIRKTRRAGDRSGKGSADSSLSKRSMSLSKEDEIDEGAEPESPDAPDYYRMISDMKQGVSNKFLDNRVKAHMREASAQLDSVSKDLAGMSILNDSVFSKDGAVCGDRSPNNPFNKVIIFEDKKMPFSLALLAKMRQKMVQEVKEHKYNKNDPERYSKIANLRLKLMPEEKARFLEKLDEVEKMKTKKEMASKNAHASTIYQIVAMDKSSKKRLRMKMSEQLPINSRFLNV